MLSRVAALYLVLCDPPLTVVAAYWRAAPAHVHARTITGASVIAIQVLEELAEPVHEMLLEDFEDDETPVTSPPRMTPPAPHDVAEAFDDARRLLRSRGVIVSETAWRRLERGTEDP